MFLISHLAVDLLRSRPATGCRRRRGCLDLSVTVRFMIDHHRARITVRVKHSHADDVGLADELTLPRLRDDVLGGVVLVLAAEVGRQQLVGVGQAALDRLVVEAEDLIGICCAANCGSSVLASCSPPRSRPGSSTA